MKSKCMNHDRTALDICLTIPIFDSLQKKCQTEK